MALNFGIKALQPGGADNLPHILGFSTPRAAAGDTLLEVWNGPTNASKVFSVDKDGKITGGGSGITALNASNLTSGTVAPARMGSGTPSTSTFLRGDGAWAAAPVTSVAGRTGAVTLSAADLTSGTVAPARLTGAYAGITGLGTLGALSVTGALSAGSLSGGGAGITSLNASALTSGTVPSARLTGSYAGITAVGTLTSALAFSARNGATTMFGASGPYPQVRGQSFTVTSTTADQAVTLFNLDGAGAGVDVVAGGGYGGVYLLFLHASSGSLHRLLTALVHVSDSSATATILAQSGSMGAVTLIDGVDGVGAQVSQANVTWTFTMVRIGQ